MNNKVGIKGFIRSIDMLGASIPICYKKDIRYKTFGGGLLSIIFILGILVASGKICIDFVLSPKFSLMTNESVERTEEIDFSNSPILISVNSASGEQMDIDPKLFTVSVYSKKRYGKDSKESLDDISTMSCDELYKQNPQYLDIFVSLPLEKFICVAPGQNILVNGDYYDDKRIYSNIYITLNKCDNKLSVCYEDDIIINKLSSVKMNVYIEKYFLKYDEDSNPLEKKSYTFPVNFELDNYHVYLLPITKQYYSIEQTSLIVKRTKEFPFFDSQNLMMNMMKKYDDSATLGDLEIFSMGMVKRIVKTKESAFELFGTIGGLFNFIYTFLLVIFSIIYDKLMILDITQDFITANNQNTGKYQALNKSISNGLFRGSVFTSNQNLLGFYNSNNNLNYLKNGGGNILQIPGQTTPKYNNIKPSFSFNFQANKNESFRDNKIKSTNSTPMNIRKKMTAKGSAKKSKGSVDMRYSVMIKNKSDFYINLSAILQKAKKNPFKFIFCPLNCQKLFNKLRAQNGLYYAFNDLLNIDNFYSLFHFLKLNEENWSNEQNNFNNIKSMTSLMEMSSSSSSSSSNSNNSNNNENKDKNENPPNVNNYVENDNPNFNIEINKEISNKKSD